MKITPRRPFDDSLPHGYLESDRDFVINNLEAAVGLLEGQLAIQNAISPDSIDIDEVWLEMVRNMPASSLFNLVVRYRKAYEFERQIQQESSEFYQGQINRLRKQIRELHALTGKKQLTGELRWSNNIGEHYE